MEHKVLEIRDRATRIPVLAVAMRGQNRLQEQALGSAGFGKGHEAILLVKLETGNSEYDPDNWDNARTMGNAHVFIQDHWNLIQEGDVIDVRVILKEANLPAKSEVFV